MTMTKLRLLLGLVVLGVVGVVVSAALAAPPAAGTCSGGLIAPGDYNGLTVTGTCFFAGGNVNVNGNLTVADGAALNDHAGSFAVVHVTGNVRVGKGAVLGLGKYGPPNIQPSGTVVDGNIVANQPASLYLSAITVHGNVTSNGGGDPTRNFPIKNLVVDGNMNIQGWSGLWIGLLRNTVGGNVVFSNNSGTQTGEDEFEGIPDSSEVATNHIGGNLICQGNTPAAQIGDAIGDGGSPNTVGGNKIGECTAV
jgi:hypothetical protein